MESSVQRTIRKTLGVSDTFSAQYEIDCRTNFLANYLKNAKASCYVLGLSGGIDSTTAGMLAQRAVDQLRESGYGCRFIAVRLPYGVQADEADAQRAIDIIKPVEVITVNIKPAVDAMMESLGIDYNDDAHRDFVKGNIKARQRMIAQYAIAGANNGLVIGTDHAAEALMGFFTKFGDGACDITPLTGLTKRRVRAVASALGVDDSLVFKTPTADLEDLDPGKPDETAYGLTYDQLDDYLEGKTTPIEVEMKIIQQYVKTEHKRNQPVGAVS